LTGIKIMDFSDLFWHLAGFMAPALVLAPAMVLVSRVSGPKSVPARTMIAQAAINFGVCLAALLGGLVVTGHDGRMGTYAALVLASAACQAWLQRGARR
jgi:predicted MFS family arabinose efflux permease